MNNREKGQLSIFLGITMLVVITILAFIVNVGLFVKAKINLQNAVDAAAWAGASVQARQLTNIGYLNWEMRNNYKEWMFKYYVIGQLAQPKTRQQLGSQGDKMSYTLKNFGLNGVHENCDPFNVPSICFHFGGTSDTNICSYYAVPGLPRFASQGIQGISQHVEGFIDTIVQAKAEDCSQRSVMNFLPTLAWAFGTGEDSELENTANVVTSRIGAWPQSILLAARIRNLEMAINYPPITEGICTSGNGCKSLTTLASETSEIGATTRPLKAFQSAFRNLSRPMQVNFKLTELAPRLPNITEQTLSHYLIPAGHQAAKKYYVDLIAYPLNLVTFFTTFVTDQGEYGGTDMQGKCTGSKTALPVPGFLFGFVKSPNVLTYYAVKGETTYRGLFFPFTGDGIPLKAYGAAKPFGGKIGPHLFSFSEDRQRVVPRDAAPQRSLSYVSGIDVGGADWASGMPIPVGDSFFALTNLDSIGGIPSASSDGVKFAIPNLLYDLEPGNVESLNVPTQGSKSMEVLTKDSGTINGPGDTCRAAQEAAGLYTTQQFKAFAANLVDIDQLHESVLNARQPTHYEALNYMIPAPERATTPKIDSVPAVPSINPYAGGFNYQLFAPLIASDGIFTTPDDVIRTVEDVILANSEAVKTYLNELQTVADKILENPQCSPTGSVDCTGAANSIYPSGSTFTPGSALSTDPTCSSLAGKFAVFYSGIGTAHQDPPPAACGILPLTELMRNYITDTMPTQPGNPYTYHNTTFSTGSDPSHRRVPDVAQVMGAYMPGPRQGATQDGQHSHPFTNQDTMLSRRNYYSTKFIAMGKILETAGEESYQRNGVYKEHKTQISASLGTSNYPTNTLFNLLPSSEMSDFDSANH